MHISVSLLGLRNIAFPDLVSHVADLTEAGADSLHLDVMDGRYVPEVTYDAHFVKKLGSFHKNYLFYVHLMVQNPEVEPYIEAGADSIAFHPFSYDKDQKNAVMQALHKISSAGTNSILAINPREDFLSWPEDWINNAQGVLIMSVTPGKGGQSFLKDSVETIRMIQKFYPEKKIMVDGGITPDVIPLLPLDIQGVVSGSFITQHPEGYSCAIHALRAASSNRIV